MALDLDRYSPPSTSALAPYVSSIWRVRAQDAYAIETVLPKGNCDLLFNFGAPIAASHHAVPLVTLASERAYLAGVQRRAFVSRPSAAVSMFGITLQIETCAALLPLPPREIGGLTVEAREVFPETSAIAEQLANAPTFEAQRRLAERWLVARIAPTPATEFIAHACRWLDRRPHDARVRELAVDQRLSERHVRRLFQAHLGFGAAHYVRLRRFVRALYLLAGGERPLIDVAGAAHYYDQPHFNREFRAFAGFSPGEYQTRRSAVPGHLFE